MPCRRITLARGHLGVARHQHAALARRHGLVGVEAEHGGVAVQRADELPAVGGGQRMGRVLHHLQAVPLRDGQDGRHVGRQTAVMHRHHALGARRDGRLQRRGADAVGGRVDVHQLHVRAQVARHLGAGGEGVGGGDDLVARAHAHRFQRQVQAGGGGIDGDGLQRRVAQEFGEGGLEALGLGPGGDPAGAQGVHHLGDLFLADLGQGEGQKRQLVGAHGDQDCPLARWQAARKRAASTG
jgi:hypothetical protein